MTNMINMSPIASSGRAPQVKLLYLLIGLLLPSIVIAESEIGLYSLWHPSEEATAMMEACLYGEGSETCILSTMRAHGASSQAIAIAEQLEGRGYLIEFEEMGRIDRATAFYPGRANDNWDPLLVNGTPTIVEVPWAVQGDVRTDPTYAALARRYSQMIMWNGDNHFEGMEARPNGGQRFVFGFNLVDGCHACEVLGVARVAFDFDETGRFLGRSFLPPETQEQATPTPPAPDIDASGRLAYIGDDGILWLLDLDSDTRQELTTAQDGYLLRWSPSGEKLLFHRNSRTAPNAPAPWLVNQDGSGLRQVADASFHDGARWSPDGERIAYISSGTPETLPSGMFSSEVFIYQVENGQVEQATTSQGLKKSLAWSPDGTKIAFGGFPPDRYEPALFIVDLSSGVERRLASIPDAADVLWHPNGETIIFEAEEAGTLGYINVADGSIDYVRLSLAYLTASLVLSPDGKQLAFTCWPAIGEDAGVCTATVDSATSRLVTQPGALPDWSPDGAHLTFAGESGIYIIPATGGEPQYVRPGRHPAWQPAGFSIGDDATTWLEEKEALILHLEEMDIPTSLFTVPAVAAYNEAAAANLLGRVEEQHERGDLSQDQLEAFIRLTLQERAFSELLPAYTEVAATISDTSVDTVETAVGALFVAKPAWDRCRDRIPFCGRLQRSTERFAWRLISDMGRTVIRNLGASPEARSTGVTFWDLIVNLVEDGFAGGHSLEDMLVDNAIEAAATATLVRLLYLEPTQQLLDDGVTTADLSWAGQKPFSIRGERVRAEMLVDSYVDQAVISKDAALQRHADFQAATDFIKLAEDVADMATLSPAALMAQSVAFWARMEHVFLINVPLTYLNYRDLDCISYLSHEVGRAVFVADEPFGSCQDRESSVPDHAGAYSKRAPQVSLAGQTLLAEEVEDYRTALAALVEATEANELSEIEHVLEQLEQAEVALADSLDELLASARHSASQSDEAFITAHRTFTTRQLSLYPALASVLMAREDEEDPLVNIRTVAEDITVQLEAVEQAAGALERLPPSEAVLVFGNIQAEVVATETVVTVPIRNIGADNAEGMRVVVLGEDQQPLADEAAGDLDAGAEMSIATNIPSDDPGSPLAVQLWVQDRLMDVEWFTLDAVIDPDPSKEVEEAQIPTEIAETAAESTGEIAQAPAAGEPTRNSPTTGPRENTPAVVVRWVRTWWPAGLALFLTAAVVTGGGLWWWRHRSDRQSIDGPNGFCIHCGAEYPPTGKFCIKCGNSREEKL